MVTPVEAARPHPPQKPELRPDQVRGLNAVVRQLRRPNSRALFVSATGTGKTLVSIRVADALEVRLVLVVVPTLDLAAQTALAWRRDGHQEHMVIVSSMDTSAHDALAARRIGSTSNSQSLAALMSVVGEEPDQLPALTVICTYDSLDKIEDTQHARYPVPAFDLAIMDEAHRIAAGRTRSGPSSTTAAASGRTGASTTATPAASPPPPHQLRRHPPRPRPHTAPTTALRPQ
ncbi:DEAD/DEAH box helicase family protein [Streptomyces violaceus]|uniref:DEAD/DEAH box helicase family protein n=1 Tax=Streptomyces violaceus TaxID=1936 RepID=A0ABY9U0M6_STRVL|nr:DEAD/DEAH box helicase family protein [Streptomyces janthinus]WND15875.1 DEAD/DEAH box helicase family protein [Streptomyces janthinus]